MKKINLIEWLSRNSHEKQKPQRFGRYAVMLIMLLTLGVGQMWAANTYYYKGEGNGTSWAKTAMTEGPNGIYDYYYVSSTTTHQFLIGTKDNDNAYGKNFVNAGYKNTDVSNIGNYGQTNCYCWQGSAHYIIVFYPNTSVNSTNSPIICAATALPSAGFESEGNTISYYNNVDGDKQSSALDRASGTTIDLTSKAITSLYLKAFNTKMYQHYEVNLLGASNYHFYYKIHRTAEAAGSTGFTEVTSADGYSAGTLTWGDFDGSKYRKPTYYVTANQSLLSGLGSGLYTMSYYFTHVGTTGTYRLPSTGSKYNELKWKIPVPPATSITVTSDGTGTGDVGTPFSVAEGNDLTITVTAARATDDDTNSELEVSFDNGSSWSTTNTLKVTPTTTPQSKTIKVRYHNKVAADALYSSVAGDQTFTAYYVATVTPSIAVTSIQRGGVAVTNANADETVTINASRQNAGEAAITYWYKQGSGSWTQIGDATTATSKSWTIPHVTATTSFQVKATMEYESESYEGTRNLSVYGKKTIKVKNTNNWSPFAIYLGAGDITNSYPGNTTNISTLGTSAQWKEVELYSSTTNFRFTHGESIATADANRTADLTFASITDNGCYEVASGTGNNLALNSTANCPTAPSVTTASATSVATTSVQFNASSVSANNDAITDYGFKWGTTDACSSGTVPASNLGAGTTFSASKTGLTNGTTYYFKAYATNGQGTTYGDPVSVRTKFITTVTLDQEGGSDGTEEVTATEGSAMPSGATAPGKTGYTFGGYYASAGGSGKKYYTNTMASANTWDQTTTDATIHANWIANPYTITLKKHNGGSDGSVSVTFDANTGLTSDVAVPTKTGYTFAGYWTGEGGTGTKLADGDGKWQKGNAYISEGGNWVNAGNVILHAAWTPNTYTVRFDVNGGTASTPDNIDVTYDAAYGTLPSGMTHTSKQFIGWYTDPDDGEGTHITAETIVNTASDHILYAHYENVYSVNVNFKCGSDVIYPATSVDASPTSLAPTITAPEIFGYTFVNWTGSNASFGDASSATTTVNATAATTVTANYNVVPTVYFKNNLGWDSVFVTFDSYFHGSYQDAPGNYERPYYKMTQLGSSDIYYCAIPSSITESWAWNIAFDNTGFNYATVKETHQGDCPAFNKGEFIGRADFDQKTTLFIPYNGDTETRNGGTFYKTGCWMKYNSTESGYQVNMNKMVTGDNADTLTVALTAANAGGYEFSAKLNLKHPNYSYGFKLYKIYQTNTNDLWYTNTGEINASTETLPWHFWAGSTITATSQRCGLHTEALGDYTITVSFATGRPMVNVEYPASVGDWRLAYNDRVAWSGSTHDASWYIYSRVIKAKADAEDIVSFYVSKADGANAHVELQKCTAITVGGVETWTMQGENLDLSSITSTGIYNFKVTQNGSKEATAAYLGSYSGDFYIRTDASDGGWNNYISSGKNLMTYSDYAKDNSGFTHYFMRFVTSGSNIKFCIANDYSPCLTEYCVSDTYTNEYIEADGNVRFMWDQRTNKVSRAYISGSSVVSDRFLVLEGSAKMFDEAGNALSISGLNANEMNFGDDQNWIYEATIKAQPKAKALLTAKYNNKVQYFGGSGPTNADSVLLIDGTGTDKYKMRIVYDFKTNRLIKAFIPDGTINTNLSINADLMIIREHQGDAQQISFGVSGALDNVKTVYGAMKFNKYTVNGKEKTGGHAATGASRYERDLFYISFPFDVKLSDAFGFGTYGQHWIIEYYDGKGRAANGFWVDSDPNWKFVMPSQRNSFTMKAFEGYILALDLDEMTESASIWDNGVEDVFVYFPSSAEVDDIQATNRLISIDQNGYECTINRSTPDGNRTIKDSYWHCIGVPSFANYNRELSPTSGGETIDWSDDDGEIDWSTPNLPYLYEWNRVDNSLSVTTSATFDFQATWSYLVQYAGTSIYWSQVNVTPASIVARERTAPTNAEFRIELQQGGEKADQTFVRLTEEENVTTGFDFNYDLSKEYNKNRANIYTMVTTVKEGDASVTQSAANVLPMSDQTTVVPVGVKIAADGDYTFAIPDGTEGIGVTLIDNETGIHTSLSALDYTINLNAGTYDNRFVIEISPISQISTDIENTEYRAQDTDVRKVLINGILYIVRDNKMYDAQGRQIK